MTNSDFLNNKKMIASFQIPKEPGKVVCIVPVEESHAEELFGVVDSNRDHLRKWLNWLDMNKTVEGQRFFCKFATTENAKSPDERSSLSCILLTAKEDRQESKNFSIIIGTISFAKISQTIKTGIVGYWLAAIYQGKGITSAAMESITEYGFYVLKFDHIALQVALENYASQAVPTRLGFEKLSLESTGRITENLYGKDIILYTYVKSSPSTADKGRATILTVEEIDWCTVCRSYSLLSLNSINLQYY
jgi:ribosomal-protein-serine acetyltransferase